MISLPRLYFLCIWCQRDNTICNFSWRGCFRDITPVNLLHIFRTPFPKNLYGELLLQVDLCQGGALNRSHLTFYQLNKSCKGRWSDIFETLIETLYKILCFSRNSITCLWISLLHISGKREMGQYFQVNVKNIFQQWL